MKTSSSRAVRACTVVLLFTTAIACSVPVSAQSATPIAVEKIAVVGTEQGFGVQISSSAPVTTEAQMITGPDRLIIDFPGALPGGALRGFRLNRGEIRAVRAGLFRSNPPVTRVVVDLNAPAAYRLVSSGNAVLVKLGSEPNMASIENVSAVSVVRHPTTRALATLSRSPEPPLRVRFDQGLLTISAKQATLADVLYQVHLRTGADIPIPSGAEQEQVAIQAGPGPAKEVLATLLNGSRFNFILQGTAQDPQGVGAVILSPKSNVGADLASEQPTAAVAPQPPAPDGQLAAPTTPPNPPTDPGEAPDPGQEIAPNPEVEPQ
jgi:AMIN domain